MLGLNNLKIVKKMNTKNLKNERTNRPQNEPRESQDAHNNQKETPGGVSWQCLQEQITFFPLPEGWWD